MPLYELLDNNNLPTVTLSSENDETLETELIMLSAAIAGIGGVAEVEKKGAYWKVIHARRSGKVRYLICKRKIEP